MFFEEPVPPDQLEAYKKVAAATSVPIATGERLANKREAKEIMATGAIKYLQPDAGDDLGILETFQMAAMAQTYGIDMAPHCWCGPVITRATAHLCAATPNLLRMEYPSTAVEDRWEPELLDPPTEVTGGEITLTDRPGLGFKINEKMLALRRVEA